MRRSLVGVLCFVTVIAGPAHGRNPIVAPVRVAAGTVLNFHLQTRLNPAGGDALDALPKGTVLQVKLLDSIDSAVDRDGAEFHGSMGAPLILGEDAVVHPKAEVQSLLRLLRSPNLPRSFRYDPLAPATPPPAQ